MRNEWACVPSRFRAEIRRIRLISEECIYDVRTISEFLITKATAVGLVLMLDGNARITAFMGFQKHSSAACVGGRFKALKILALR